ncbi:MAG TPA: stage II sporulation protein M [Pirellulaceae bacterium]|nr:stage II sporulation protein M [Pirellulaceae bacterium]
MKVSELLEKRRRNWQELESLCDQLALRSRKSLGPMALSRFSSLYRSACADLALADAYQLPPNTVQYLHRLVGRAHNQLYRSRKFQWQTWADILLHQVPQTIFNDRCVQLAFLVFWGIFILSAALSYSTSYWPEFAQELVGREQLEQMSQNFEASPRNPPETRFLMAGFYIQHNTGIGLQCFAWGLLVVPGLMVTMYNAAVLGASFGYMARPDVAGGDHFFEFVTAHGPFELTAIVLSAGAGLRLGLAWIFTNGQTREASLRSTATEAMPIMGAAMILFFLAALLEGFLSPSNAPYWVKAGAAVISSLMMMFYFILLGLPRRTSDAT